METELRRGQVLVWSSFSQMFNPDLLLIVAHRLNTMRTRARGRWGMLLIHSQATTTKVSLLEGLILGSLFLHGFIVLPHNQVIFI